MQPSAPATARTAIGGDDDDEDVSDDENTSDAEEAFMMQSTEHKYDSLAKDIERDLPDDMGCGIPGIGQFTQPGRQDSFIIIENPSDPLNTAPRESIVIDSVDGLFPMEDSGE